MSGFLGCFVVLFPSSSLRSRAVDYAELEDEEQLIASGSSGITSLVSHGDTVTSASSLRGIGTLSGKAIMAVGNVLIRGIEVVDIQRRLRRITTQLGKSDADLSPEALEDLFELQRCVPTMTDIRVQTQDRLPEMGCILRKLDGVQCSWWSLSCAVVAPSSSWCRLFSASLLRRLDCFSSSCAASIFQTSKYSSDACLSYIHEEQKTRSRINCTNLGGG